MTTIKKLQMLAEMQASVQKAKEKNLFTKKNLCDICIPVRDALGLTDAETLSVANNTATLSEIVLMLQKTPDTSEEVTA